VDEVPKLRPLPPPPRCRGIPLGDGNYTGCAYGYGDLAPFTGPRDCPVCNGSGFEGPIETTLPHSDFGDPDCCGCLNGVIRGEQADIVCNECDTVLRTVPAVSVGQTLTKMEITLEVASEMCPHCGSVILSPGFARMLASVHPSAVRKGRSASRVVSLARRAPAGHGLQRVRHGHFSLMSFPCRRFTAVGQTVSQNRILWRIVGRMAIPCQRKI
jgi:hypothetical protein